MPNTEPPHWGFTCLFNWYKATALHTAWGLLIDAAKNGDCDEGQEGQEGQGNGSSTSNGNMHGTPNGNIHGNSSHRLSRAFVFDLVDVGREYLSIAPCMVRHTRIYR